MKLTIQIPSSTSLIPSLWPARTVEMLIFLRCRQMRLWCTMRVVGVGRCWTAFSCDALRYRHPEVGHAVQHRAADPGFGLLSRQSPGAKPATDDGFVAEHGRLSERAPAVADCLLPAQAPFVLDRLDVL